MGQRIYFFTHGLTNYTKITARMEQHTFSSERREGKKAFLLSLAFEPGSRYLTPLRSSWPNRALAAFQRPEHKYTSEHLGVLMLDKKQATSWRKKKSFSSTVFLLTGGLWARCVLISVRDVLSIISWTENLIEQFELHVRSTRSTDNDMLAWNG